MTKDQILKKYPDLARIFVENGIMNRKELNFLEIDIPDYHKKNYGVSSVIKGSARIFTAGVNGNILTIHAEVDHNEKIISSSTEWSEDQST